MLTVFFQTFGCQMNVADSDELRQKLALRGYTASTDARTADLLIINTCSVREHAEERAQLRIREYCNLKKKSAELWVIGCMAQRLGDSLKKDIRGITRVIGARSIERFDELLDSFIGASLESSFPEQATTSVSDFITIIRGCNNYCSYCIVPYVRGPELSIDADHLIATITAMTKKGIKEITLLGQNVNSYNDNGIDFPDLLHRVAAVPGIERIRFTTSHPKDCSPKLIDTIATLPQCCKHFHLAVQSGSDRILQRMNRRYTASHFLALTEQIRKKIPQADITTDIIVGFPAETEEDFAATLKLVEKVRFTSAFMFAYSPREGTKAAAMHDDIPEAIKQQRLRTLIDRQTAITREIYAAMESHKLTLLITRQQEKRDRFWMGLDHGCKRALVTCDNLKAGMILQVKVIRTSGMTLICERVE